MDKTAHATNDGLLILCGPASERKAVLLAAYRNATVLDSKKYGVIVNRMGLSMNETMTQSDERELAEEASFIPADILDMLENANYPGRTTNVQELKSAEIGYGIGDESEEDGEPTKIFQDETLSWRDHNGQVVVVKIEGEMLGRFEVGENIPSQDLLEPLTLGEAMTLVKTFFPAEEILSRDAASRSVESYLLPMLQNVKDIIELSLENNESGGQPRFSDLTELFPKSFQDKAGEGWELLWSRIKASIKRRNIGQPWSYQDIYSMGERHGVTDIMTELVVQDKSASDLMEPDDLYERTEQARETSMYNEFYDAKGVNRGWSDRSLYYARCKEKKQWLYENLRAHLLKKPRASLKVYLTDESPIRKAYKKSVKACSPGPVKKLVDGKWENQPLTGQEARKVLLEKGFKPDQLTERSTFFRCERWHKLLITKELLDKLEQDIRNYINEMPSLGSKFPQESRALPVQSPTALKVAEKR